MSRFTQYSTASTPHTHTSRIWR